MFKQFALLLPLCLALLAGMLCPPLIEAQNPAPTITLTVADHVYGDAPFVVSATSTNAGSIPSISVVSGPATASGNTVTLTGIGSVTLRASQLASGAFSAGILDKAFNVAPKPPSITFPIGNHTKGDGPFQVTATVDSKATPTYSVVSGPATISDNTVTITNDGTVTLRASVPATGNYAAGTQDASFTVAAAAASTQLPCPNNCFLSLGAGSVLNSTKFGDYTDSSNILQTTHLGASTPQYAVGLSYRLPIYGPFSKIPQLHCGQDAYTVGYPEARAAYCFPYKAFVNFKFTPDSSQTFNGYTFGLSHSLAYGYLDVMVGLSYTPFNEVSPGFQQAALNVVATQQAANNPYYAQYSLAALKANNPTAFDGFPVQLLKADGTTGALIYGASPLVNHYHSGLFLGVSIPVSLKTFLGPK